MMDEATTIPMETSTASPPHPISESTLQPESGDQQPSIASNIISATLSTNGMLPSPPAETTYPKRLLPDSLSSPFPHGLITGELRTSEQQAAFEARKAEILATMTADKMEESYRETAKEVQGVLQEIKEGNEKIDKEIEDAKKTREMERRAWLGIKKAAADE